MITPLRLFAMLAVSAAVAATTVPEIVYSGIPWRTPVDSVRVRLQAQGFAFSREEREHDLVFTRGDGSEAKAAFQDGRLVAIDVADPARGPAVNERFRALVDSFTAAVGQPDTAGAQEAHWHQGLSDLEMFISFDGAVRHVEIDWAGPGALDEMARRYEMHRDSDDLAYPALPATYTRVGGRSLAVVAVDTSLLRRGAGGIIRGRFRIGYPRSVGPADDEFDSAEYEMDFDCAHGKTRLVSRTVRLKGEVRHHDVHDNLPWESPRPDGHYVRGLDAVCRTAAVLRPAR
ncbi:MAG: hypothetical protein JO306_15005 [Gemmatimonadetes bacterium]|nr:hypothetical protein [Gemmatimonadota bacterium]